MSDFFERLRIIRKETGLTQAEFAELGGVTSASQGNYERGTRKPDSSYLEAVASRGIDVGYLLTGVRATPALKEDLPTYRTLSGATPAPADCDDEFRVALMGATGSMGAGHHQLDGDVVKHFVPFSRQWLLRFVPASRLHDLRLILSGGDSMRGTINDGDFSLVATDDVDYSVPGVFVLQVYRNMYIKRVSYRVDGTMVVTSDNPDDPVTEELAGDHQLNVLGRVLYGWNGRRF